MPICPAGHTSSQSDFCDTCGLPIPPQVQAPVPDVSPAASPVLAAAGIICPACQTPNVPDALFCEACGFDFVSGQPTAHPSPAPPAPPGGAPASNGSADAPSPAVAEPRRGVEWVAELWIDPDWYASQGSTDPLPSPGLPDIVPLVKESNLIGRVSVSRNIYPDVDCELDTGCSRRHARLTTDGMRWWIEDLESANGTFVGSSAGPLPAMPIPRGRTELAADTRVYVGAWTRIVIRRATVDEQAAFAGVPV
ncbi:MAG: FHA domain-containing protein [Propionibacteriaceae bacterium]|nr:FHA domain-containing protein [Propionibacteriaceae bacterium]